MLYNEKSEIFCLVQRIVFLILLTFTSSTCLDTNKPQLGNNNRVTCGRRSRRQTAFFNLWLARCQPSTPAKGPLPSSCPGDTFMCRSEQRRGRNPTLTDDLVAPGVTPRAQPEWRCHSACSWTPARGKQASAADITLHLDLLSRTINKCMWSCFSGCSGVSTRLLVIAPTNSHQGIFFFSTTASLT